MTKSYVKEDLKHVINHLIHISIYYITYLELSAASDIIAQDVSHSSYGRCECS